MSNLENKSEVKTDIKTENTEAKTKKELSREEKKNLRRSATDVSGRLYMNEANKEKGYTYRVCNVLPGNIEKYKMFGGEIVTHKVTSGNGGLSTPEVDGVPREFEVGGIASGSMKAVWMRFTDEDYEIMKELEREEADHQANMLKGGIDPLTGEQMIPKDNLIGTITKGYK